ncbi:protein O-mannosyl-transferase TMTC1-like [Harmonia axyridis]|uniref:protein O-mannosyl-transferase TMTC1-like n=1 Tax=Harmonia axyridis TaxID=115357 RepID=UPI001E277DEF|nr:protein O-mannosyl-transferase TMTC1-like [Harmonia axyridis]
MISADVDLIAFVSRNFGRMDSASVICCLVAFLLYYNTLEAGFVYDDRRAILGNTDLLSKNPWTEIFHNDFWGTRLNESGSHGSYRPLCVLTYRLNYLLNGFQPWGYHLVNIVLHCLATLLLIKVSRRLLPKSKQELGSAVTGLTFAAHPIHTEAVASVVGRADLAACNLFLLAFLAFSKHVKLRDNNKDRDKDKDDYNTSKHGLHKQINSKYQKIVHSLHKNVTSCHWTRRCSKEMRTESHCVVQKVYATAEMEECEQYSSKRIKVWTYLSASIVLAAASMLSKETGITVVGVCLLYDYVYSSASSKKKWQTALPLVISTVIILMFRLQNKPPNFSTADNPTSKEPKFLTRFLTFSYLPVFNIWLLLFPSTLSFDWGMDAIPRLSSLADPRSFLTIMFYVILIVTVKYCLNSIASNHDLDKRHYRKRDTRRTKSCTVCNHCMADCHTTSCRTNNNNNSVNGHLPCMCLRHFRSTSATTSDNRRNLKTSHVVLLSIGFLAMPFLPATNLFFYVGFVVAERVLYIPSIGWCLLLGLAFSSVWNNTRYRPSLVVCLVTVLVAFGVKTVLRNGVWFNEESLYRSAVPVNPPKAYGNLGSILSSQGRTYEAEVAFRKALEYRPNMADVHYNLGIILQGSKRLEEAIESYKRAIHFRPTLALAYVNLGTALIAIGRCEEAISILKQGSKLDGTGLKDQKEHDSARVSALLQLGALYSDQGRLQKALVTYREAVYSLPNHYPPQSVFNVLGETLARLQQDEEAESWYRAALNAQPDHVPAHITYGKLLAKNVSRLSEAEQWFRRAQKLAPGDPSVYHYYGEFLASTKRYKEAAVHYERAAQLRPIDFELAVAAATAMRQAERYEEAEMWYRRAVEIKPMDARSYTNLGAILHLNRKYAEAASSYRHALKLQPNDATTITNLHKLHAITST